MNMKKLFIVGLLITLPLQAVKSNSKQSLRDGRNARVKQVEDTAILEKPEKLSVNGGTNSGKVFTWVLLLLAIVSGTAAIDQNINHGYEAKELISGCDPTVISDPVFGTEFMGIADPVFGTSMCRPYYTKDGIKIYGEPLDE